MNTGGELRTYLSRLATHFDQNLRTNPQDASQRGWGQFIAAEPHSHQIGLYGTSAGILVKTIANPDAHIDDAVVTYLQRQWDERGASAQKYFNQTIRLAFLVLALARVRSQNLAALRDDATNELMDRQLPDGGWGDWKQEPRAPPPPPRPEATAWAMLALIRLPRGQAQTKVFEAARFLQRHALGYSDIERSVDPVVIAAIVRALPTIQIHRRIRSAAISFLTDTRPQDELQIYFFDYLFNEAGVERVKRDYLCVPRFLPFCALAGAPNLGARDLSIEGLRIALAHWRATKHLEAVLATEPLRTPRARYPATVDQAIVALAVELLQDRTSRLGWFFSTAVPAIRFLRRSSVFRVLLPLLLITLLGAIAQDPKNISEVTTWALGVKSDTLSNFVSENGSIMQLAAIALGFLIGQPLLDAIWRFFRDKWAP